MPLFFFGYRLSLPSSIPFPANFNNIASRRVIPCVPVPGVHTSHEMASLFVLLCGLFCNMTISFALETDIRGPKNMVDVVYYGPDDGHDGKLKNIGVL